MKRPANYNTKQKEVILNYIVSLKNMHVTAAQIIAHFEQADYRIGRTTIFRHLDKLTESGKIRRYITDGISGSCYQYVESGEHCDLHLHLKCENCGELQHIECDALNDMQKHISEKHAFEVNAIKTVLYGKCDNCLDRA